MAAKLSASSGSLALLDTVVLIAMGVTSTAFATGLVVHSHIDTVPAVIAGSALFMIMASSHFVVTRSARSAAVSGRISQLEEALVVLDQDLQRIDKVEDDVARLDLLNDRIERLDTMFDGAAVPGDSGKVERLAADFEGLHTRLESLRADLEGEARSQREKISGELKLLETLIKQLARELSSAPAPAVPQPPRESALVALGEAVSPEEHDANPEQAAANDEEALEVEAIILAAEPLELSEDEEEGTAEDEQTAAARNAHEESEEDILALEEDSADDILALEEGFAAPSDRWSRTEPEQPTPEGAEEFAGRAALMAVPEEHLALEPEVEDSEDSSRLSESPSAADGDSFAFKFGVADDEANTDEADRPLDLASGHSAPIPAPKADAAQSPTPETSADPALVATLRDAIERTRIELYLRPVVTLPERRLRYCEALPRVRAADGGLLLPEALLPAARSAGLMPLIDNVALVKSVQFLRRLATGSDVRGVFVGLSVQSLLDREFFPELVEFLEENSVLAESLFFELAQGEIASLSPDDARSLDRLGELGFRFALDRVADFDLDPGVLAGRHFRFIKLEAAKCLRLFDDDSKLPANDAQSYFRRFGLELIVDRVDDETSLGRLLEHGVGLAAGSILGEPKPFNADFFRELEEAGAA